MYNCITNNKGGIIMELTQLNSANNFMNTSKITNNQELSKVNNVQSETKKIKPDTVEIALENKSKSSFVNDISFNINKISQLQKTQSAISNQIEITTKIVQVTNTAIQSSNIKLDDKQPQIQDLLNTYNIIASDNEDFEKEGIFFDGRIGSKPLSASKIFDALTKQNDKLQQKSLAVNAEINTIVANTQETINSVKTSIEFKNIDFEKESLQFNASTINNIKGGVVPSQANALPLNSERLLA